MTFKPLLAEKADLSTLTFPLIASPKIDGIRCLIDPERGPVSRKLKSIPNRHIRSILETSGINYLDGEIVTYDDAGNIDDFNTVQSKVMSEDGEPAFIFHVFDCFKRPLNPYTDRLADVLDIAPKDDCYIQIHTYQFVHSLDELAQLETQFIDVEGWEGVMVRRPDGRYKYGRSTAKEQILLKIKRFEDSEAIVTGTIERMHNANEAKKDALGRTERSTSKENLVPTNSLGALSVEWRGVSFELGTGFTEAQRQELWSIREELVGKTVTFKYQGVGSQGAPRFPVFLGFRYDVSAAA